MSKTRSIGGYNFLEFLFALLFMTFLLGLVNPILIIMMKLNVEEEYRYQDEIGIYQLQIVLATNKIVEVNDDEIQYLTTDNSCLIEFVNNNLISTPGCVIFLHDIENVNFRIEDDIVYMEYERKEKWYEYAIAYAKK